MLARVDFREGVRQPTGAWRVLPRYWDDATEKERVERVRSLKEQWEREAKKGGVGYQRRRQMWMPRKVNLRKEEVTGTGTAVRTKKELTVLSLCDGIGTVAVALQWAKQWLASAFGVELKVKVYAVGGTSR